MWLLSYRRGVLGLSMAAALAAASLLLPTSAPSAHTTLYFPSARPVDWIQLGEKRKKPVDWAHSLLLSARAGEQIRKSLSPDTSPDAAAAASLLTDGDHLHMQAREPGLLQIEVTEARPEVALVVCQAVVTFLKKEVLMERNRRVDAGLASLVREQANALERQETAEGEIVLKLRQAHQTEPTSSEPDAGLFQAPDPLNATSREDFLVGLVASRQLHAQELRLALQEETSLPGFSVVDPPQLCVKSRPIWVTPAAALLGLLLGVQYRARRSLSPGNPCV